MIWWWAPAIYMVGVFVALEIAIKVRDHGDGAANIAVAALIWPIYLPLLALVSYVRWRDRL